MNIFRSIEKAVNQKFLEQFFPPQFSEEIQKAAPDLVNQVPTDLALNTNDELVSNDILPSDIFPGSPSPGLWLLFPVIMICAFMTAYLSIDALAAAKISIHPIKNYMKILGMLWPAIGFGMATLSLIVLLMTEQEMSTGTMTTIKVAALAIIVSCAIPFVLPLLLTWKFYQAFRNLVATLFFGVLAMACAPFLLPLSTLAIGLAGLFAYRIFFASYFMGRENKIRSVGLETSMSAIQKDRAITRSALIKQAEKASNDTTQFISFGISKNILRPDGDAKTPDPHREIGESVKDLSTGVFAFGSPGTGKTVWFRLITWQWYTQNCGGFLLMDGKGALHLELAKFLDKVVDPFRCHINPLEGLEATKASTILLKVCAKAQSKDFFDTSTEGMIRTALLVIKDLNDRGIHDFGYSLEGLYEYCTLEARRIEILAIIDDDSMPGFLKRAYDYWRNFDTVDQKLKDSQFATFNTWLNSIVINPSMVNWASTKSDINIVDAVMRGKKIGVAAPEHLCGMGGTLALSLIKATFYDKIAQRADDPYWASKDDGQPVLLMIDECKDIITQGADAEAVSKGRSLGLKPIFATQNAEQLAARLGGKEHLSALLDMFAGRVTLPTGNKFTNELSCDHAGTRYRFISEEQEVENSSLSNTVKAAAAQSDDKGRLADMIATFTDMISFRKKQISLSNDMHSNSDSDGRRRETLKGKWKLMNTVTPDELNCYLQEPQTALIVVERAGVKRREICDLTLPSDHPCLAIPTEAELEALKIVIESDYKPNAITPAVQVIKELDAGRIIDLALANMADGMDSVEAMAHARAEVLAMA